jgi:cyclophilin family peptidyl-prolyl cis-trans isomerase
MKDSIARSQNLATHFAPTGATSPARPRFWHHHHLVLALAAVVMLGACKDDQKASSPPPAGTATSSATTEPSATSPTATTPTTTSNTTSSPSAMAGKPYIPAGYALVPFLTSKPVRVFKEAPKYALDDSKDYAAVMDTDAGRMVIALYTADTPTTVNSFVFLARNHYYDGIAFHRVIDNFVVQGGDPNTISGDASSWGQGGAGYEFCLEVRQKYKFDTKGVIGMARTSDPCSNGSQFYITLAATPNLDGQYTVFGKITEGLDVLDKVTRGEPPQTPTRMKSVYIVSKKK